MNLVTNSTTKINKKTNRNLIMIEQNHIRAHISEKFYGTRRIIRNILLVIP